MILRTVLTCLKRTVKKGAWIRITLHSLAWVILLVLPVYFVNRWEVRPDFIWLYYINMLISGTIFYLNYFWLVPRYFLKGRKILYALLMILLILAFYCISDTSNRLVFKYKSERHTAEPSKSTSESREFDNDTPEVLGEKRYKHPPFRQMHFFNYILNAIFLTFFSMGIRVLERHNLIEKRQKELEKEKLDAELNMLKNQVSPHFFFNTLNNIYALIEMNPAHAREAMLKLSRLMRYLLYESQQETISLDREVEFLSNFIDLMRLRISDKVKLDALLPGGDQSIFLPPLLFVPFVENAFKHGISNREDCFIRIDMKVEADGITFACANSLPLREDQLDLQYSGIGLDNVKKRLTLLFGNRQLLTISKTDNHFAVNLHIIIEPNDPNHSNR